MDELFKILPFLIFIIALIYSTKKPKQKSTNKKNKIYKKQHKSNEPLSYIDECWNEIEKHK